MNWGRVTCDECGYSDYDDNRSNRERKNDRMLCASCRVNQILSYNESGDYYE